MTVTPADFQSSGIDPLSNDLLKRILRGVANCLLTSFSTLGGTWSGPCALFGFNLFSLSWTAFGVTHKSAKVILFDLFPHFNMGHVICIIMCKNTYSEHLLQMQPYANHPF